MMKGLWIPLQRQTYQMRLNTISMAQLLLKKLFNKISLIIKHLLNLSLTIAHQKSAFRVSKR